MENKSHAMAAGIFVVLVAALLAGLALWLTRDRNQYTLYEMTTKDGIGGLQPQAAVRYKGVPVGKVMNIGFDPQANGNVLIRIAVDTATPISPNTFATMGYQGVTGLAHIQLDDATEPPPPQPPGQSGLPRLWLKSSPLSMLADQGPALLGRVDEVTRRVNDILGDENQRRFSEMLDNISGAAASVRDLSADVQHTLTQRVNPALADFPALTSDARKTLQSLDQAGQNAAAVAADLGETVQRINAPEGPLEQIAEGTQALVRAADSLGRTTLPHVSRAADDVSRAARQLGAAAGSFSDNPQSVIYGSGRAIPGPGEPGFAAPTTQP
ncbi:MlaD family protein [Comamonas endophytica]|uniref:MlaD family protein n=1 Tax=Comamonas endophytica TaxID=2949090 RepID=A0ABY6GDE4_9BURK|nr:MULTISPECIES: MlaD family protein [unclassified Acidovorax]MCD2512606.1 MlaD family protein [Acidovorax sp. D4N7]UYG53034.1 MlaD family protein [Acidovorax sp. 5MLIR]